MKRVGKVEYAAAVSLLSIGVIAFCCVIGGFVSWLLLIVWNFFAGSVGLPLVLPVTLKSIFALWCLLVVIRVVFRRQDKKQKG